MRMSVAALLAAGLVAAGLPALPAPARAEIEVDVNRGDIRPLPLSIPAFSGDRGEDIARVISDNLGRSGLFAPIEPGGRQADVATEPDFAVWKSLGAQALVNGQVTVVDGRLQVDFRLWDTFAGQQLLGLQFTSTPENWRRVAHKISDAVYERLTGEKGYFDTRVVFVSTWPCGRRDHRSTCSTWKPVAGRASASSPAWSSPRASPLMAARWPSRSRRTAIPTSGS